MAMALPRFVLEHSLGATDIVVADAEVDHGARKEAEEEEATAQAVVRRFLSASR